MKPLQGLRAAQKDILAYNAGRMGVSAVPGSGKTFVLSHLAARLIAEGQIDDDQEVLIVTLVNSAVDNFSARLAGILTATYGLLPDLGYRIRTLHGLAHDIVRERPDLAGLPNRFTIADERETGEILRNTCQNWMKAHPEFVKDYINPEVDASNWKVQKGFPDLVVSIAGAFIRQAKDLELSPELIRQRLGELQAERPLLAMGWQIYSDYQQALRFRSAVDFDDLIRLALQTLRSDPDYLERLRRRWPVILEDEAQDSSHLQESILEILAGPDGGWVRVGDPNQAIYETFTTASPEFLMRFLNRRDVVRRDLPDSGRSTASIIRLANQLIRWSRSPYCPTALYNKLTPPEIQPVRRGDPQPNPPDDAGAIFLMDGEKYLPEDEIRAVVRSLQRWLPEHPDQTAACLVPRNDRGAELVEKLKQAGIEAVELLQSSLETRSTARLLASILHSLSDPTSMTKLVRMYQEIGSRGEADPTQVRLVQDVSQLLGKCPFVEDYLWPQPDRDWLASLNPAANPERVQNELANLRKILRRWQNASILPVGQLILTISQDVFSSPAELALAFKLSQALESAADSHPEWRLTELTDELETIVHNQRKFSGFSVEDTGFNPDAYPGKVVVATMHKAKGLEWDRVYLLSVSSYDFPAALEGESNISERWFIRRQLNLEAEIIAEIDALAAGKPIGSFPVEGEASRAARHDYAAERLRLLYVGITRARRELVITWNTGRRGMSTAAAGLTALAQYWKEDHHDSAA
jgi:DNA helicase II / ATP-dependent DNA helicase PcrA